MEKNAHIKYNILINDWSKWEWNNKVQGSRNKRLLDCLTDAKYESGKIIQYLNFSFLAIERMPWASENRMVQKCFDSTEKT